VPGCARRAQCGATGGCGEIRRCCQHAVTAYYAGRSLSYKCEQTLVENMMRAQPTTPAATAATS
jgi:hypothetical protein